MRKVRTRLNLVFAALLFSGVSYGEEQAFKDLLPEGKIVYTSNVSGEIEPCGCRKNPTGSISRKWNFFKKEFKFDRSKVLIIDSGDLFFPSQPTPPFLEKQWNLQAENLLKSYNETGCDVFSPGDLDFASGLEQFEKLKGTAKFPFISANIYKGDKPYLEEFIVLEKAGKKIALFGLIDETLKLPEGLIAKPHLEVAKELVSKLKKKADLVFALTHLGYEKDVELAKAVSGIDAIFGAHSQSFLQEPVKVEDTLIFQTSFRNQHIGLFKEGKNLLVSLDEQYDEGTDATANPMYILRQSNKAGIAKLNKENEAELSMTGTKVETHDVKKYQTFVRCAECHFAQYEFHAATAHFKAYKTLMAKKQNHNKDCLQCHTLGMNEKEGWKKTTALVFYAHKKKTDKAQTEDPEKFVKKLPVSSGSDLMRYDRVFMNVQCEHCHGPADKHPFGGTYSKTVNTSLCLKCHTQLQAPGWYRGGEANEEVIKEKLKMLTCPKSQ